MCVEHFCVTGVRQMWLCVAYQKRHKSLCDIGQLFSIKKKGTDLMWFSILFPFYMPKSQRVHKRLHLAQRQESDTHVSSGCWEWQKKQGPQNRLWRKKRAMVQILRQLRGTEERGEHNRVMAGGLASSCSIDNESQTHVTQIEFDEASRWCWPTSKWCRQ